ncbi:hypothetical protein AWW66_08305 [Micromonospora rosaria]|uniref:FAD dependent oxidoreductase domain-containing protein n=1 Tax=Micromonospora rosaria TaxID=47874 RepID=A0A136PW97_9ACTN|nr:FAD-dependent oxidoreductase [Micromonospora rosaria]KXK62436.1 hypothetical protein AWW66_08305 [Micromonospora rosaria]
MHITVVGGGVIGLLTAVESVLAGHRVTVVEQAALPNAAAASADRHRIIRALHLGDGGATTAAARAHRRWIELEKTLYTRFYDRVGALSVLPEDQIVPAVSLLGYAGVWSRVLRGADLAERYPMLSFAPDATAVLEREAGVLLADRVLRGCLGWLRWQPTVGFVTHQPVRAIDPAAKAVNLADGTVLTGDAVLVAAGAWSRDLLPPSVANRLTLYRQSMLYCDVDDERAWSTLAAMPSLGGPQRRWLVPPVAGTPLKLSAHSACRPVSAIDDHDTDAAWREHLLDAFAPLIPALRGDWVTAARDCYYLADDVSGGALAARLGDQVVAYAACGGTSFKFAPLIAEALVRCADGSLAEMPAVPTVTVVDADRPIDVVPPEGDRQ